MYKAADLFHQAVRSTLGTSNCESISRAVCRLASTRRSADWPQTAHPSPLMTTLDSRSTSSHQLWASTWVGDERPRGRLEPNASLKASVASMTPAIVRAILGTSLSHPSETHVDNAAFLECSSEELVTQVPICRGRWRCCGCARLRCGQMHGSYPAWRQSRGSSRRLEKGPPQDRPCRSFR